MIKRLAGHAPLEYAAAKRLLRSGNLDVTDEKSLITRGSPVRPRVVIPPSRASLKPAFTARSIASMMSVR